MRLSHRCCAKLNTGEMQWMFLFFRQPSNDYSIVDDTLPIVKRRVLIIHDYHETGILLMSYHLTGVPIANSCHNHLQSHHRLLLL